MTDDRLIGQVLAMQTKRITELRNLVDELAAKVQANSDTLNRIHHTITERNPR